MREPLWFRIAMWFAGHPIISVITYAVLWLTFVFVFVAVVVLIVKAVW